MSITRRGATTTLQSREERTKMEAAKPAGSEATDILIVQPYVEVNGKVISVAGGTAITPQVQVSTTWRTGAFWVPGSQANIAVTWEGNENKGCTCLIEGWIGVDNAAPVDSVNAFQTLEGIEVTVAALTIVNAGAFELLTGVNGAIAEMLKETPAGYTLGSGKSPFEIYRERAAAGSTGTQVVKVNAGAGTERFLRMALKPAGAGAASSQPGMLVAG